MGVAFGAFLRPKEGFGKFGGMCRVTYLSGIFYFSTRQKYIWLVGISFLLRTEVYWMVGLCFCLLDIS